MGRKIKPKERQKNKEEDWVDIQKMRKANGFSLIREGHRLCLRCDNKFYSEDLKNEKICNLCKEMRGF